MSAIAVLVIGYNRADFLESRLFELNNLGLNHVYVSIDCNSNGQIDFDIDRIRKQKYPNFQWIYAKQPFGIGKHVPHAVTSILKQFEGVVVIEDDCKISPRALVTVISLLEGGLEKDVLSIGFHSSLAMPWFLKGFKIENCWRKSHFFSPWGWGTTREAWRHYSQELHEESIESDLRNSIYWNSKQKISQDRWLRRFKLVSKFPNITWDYQMNYASFRSNKFHLIPIYRSVENVGFDSERATNTKEKRPFWYWGESADSSFSECGKCRGMLARLASIIDAFTWAGDLDLKRDAWRLLTGGLKKRIGRIFRGSAI